jgi:hypothetical protein
VEVPPTIVNAEQPEPRVVYWLRGYARLMSFIGAAFILILLFALSRVQQMLPDMEIQGAMLGCLGGTLLAVHVPVLFFKRKSWVWIYDLVVICLGLSSCFVFICVPLLIYWIKPEVKKYFGRTD